MPKDSKVFVDSNVFIALYVKDDSLHEKAYNLWNELQKNEVKLTTSELVISEVLTVLRLKADRKTAIRFGDIALEETKNLNVLSLTPELMKFSYKIFKEVEEKDFSFVDASIVAISHKLGMKVVTFDQILLSALES